MNIAERIAEKKRKPPKRVTGTYYLTPKYAEMLDKISTDNKIAKSAVIEILFDMYEEQL